VIEIQKRSVPSALLNDDYIFAVERRSDLLKGTAVLQRIAEIRSRPMAGKKMKSPIQLTPVEGEMNSLNEMHEEPECLVHCQMWCNWIDRVLRRIQPPRTLSLYHRIVMSSCDLA